MKQDETKLSKYMESRLRLISDSFDTSAEERQHLYMPVALAHVYFPRRDVDPTKGSRSYDPETKSYNHTSGNFHLSISQLPVMNHKTGKNQYMGFPYGPKSRLLLGAINALALQQGSNKIDIEANSLPKFLRNIGMTDGGNQIKEARKQIGRLSSSLISVSYLAEDGSSTHGQMPIVKGFDLFPRSNPDQELLWNRHIILSQDYWEELQRHPLPLALEHMMILSGSARAIDFYTFLAYRLHSLRKPLFLTWQTMKEIFGGDIDRMDNFKAKMVEAATLTQEAYREARFSCDGAGWTFHNSPSPIPKKSVSFGQKFIP